MKLRANTSELRNALSRLSCLPGANGPMLFTHAVTIEAGMDGISLSRSTSEATVTVDLSEGVEIIDSEGEIMVPHQTLSNLLGACRTQEVILDSDDKAVKIESGKAKLSVKVFTDEAKVNPPKLSGETVTVDFALEDFISQISFASQAMLPDSDRTAPVFGAVAIRSVNGKLAIMATDKKRAHVALMESYADVDVVIPAEGVSTLLKVVGAQKGAAHLICGDNMVTLEADGFSVSVALLNENFPDSVQKFMELPDSFFEAWMDVPKDELAEEMKRCAMIVGDQMMANCELTETSLVIRGSNNKDSDILTSIDCTASGPRSFAMNGKWLGQALDGLRANEDGRIRLFLHPSAIMAKQSDRLYFMAPRKTETPKAE